MKRRDCDEEYIEGSTRTFGKMIKEHLKAHSLICGHHSTTGHTTTLDNFNIVGREGQYFARPIKGSIFIRVKNPTLKRNIVKYKPPHMWNRVLFSLSPPVSRLGNIQRLGAFMTTSQCPAFLNTPVSFIHTLQEVRTAAFFSTTTCVKNATQSWITLRLISPHVTSLKFCVQINDAEKPA